MTLRRSGLLESQKVFYLRPAEIKPNPNQPRQHFDLDGLRALSESIAQYGVLQPLTVRKTSGGYELVAGERRLRASQMIGLTQVPCLLLDIDAEQSSLIALVENLQRRDLDFFEEAEGLETLIRLFGLSQEEAAQRVGMSQSAVANKLRLLRHPPEVVSLIRKHNLTERHARALLRLEEYSDRVLTLDKIIRQRMNVAQTEQYIDNLLSQRVGEAKPPKLHTLIVLKDVRIFFNTVNRAVELMRRSGVGARVDRQDTGDAFVLTISIPK